MTYRFVAQKLCALAFVSLLAAPARPALEIQTSINDIFERGLYDLAGTLTFRVTGDDFPSASEANPVVLTVTLDHDVLLAENLVDPGTDGLDVPIALALSSEAPTLLAPAAAVFLTRWVRGEDSFEIQIRSSTSGWLDVGAPSIVNPVTFSVGVSARASWTSQNTLPTTRRNLPANTRDPVASVATPAEFLATSTLACVDAATSNLTTSGVDSMLNASVTGVGGASQIARAKTRSCTVTRNGDYGLRGSSGGFDTLTGSTELTIDCEQGGQYLDTPLLPTSYVRLDGGSGTGRGFENGDARFLAPSGEPPVPPGATAGFLSFPSNGTTLNRFLDLIWTGPPTPTNDYRVLVEATIKTDDTQPFPSDVNVGLEVVLVSGAGPFDDFPFDGPEQAIRCRPSQFLIFDDQWRLDPSTIDVPTLSPTGLLALLLCVAGVGVVVLRRS